jgi:hypothetical protein
MLSKNGVAIVVLALSAFGLNVAESEIITFLANVGQVVAFLVMIWNQFTRTDVYNFIFKKW